MPQCIVSWLVQKIPQIFIRFSILPGPRLSSVYNIGRLFMVFDLAANIAKIKLPRNISALKYLWNNMQHNREFHTNGHFNSHKEGRFVNSL